MLDRVIHMDVKYRALLMTYALIIATVKGRSLELSDLSKFDLHAENIVRKLLEESRSPVQFQTLPKMADLSGVITWAKDRIKTTLNPKIQAFSKERSIQNLLITCRNNLLQDLDTLHDVCKFCIRKPSFHCREKREKRKKLFEEWDYCPHCMELLISELGKDLFEYRRNRVRLKEVKLCTSWFDIRTKNKEIFDGGQILYGVGAKTEPDRNSQNVFYTILYFDPQDFKMEGYLALPYLLLHEYAVHGLTKIQPRSDRWSIFYEGWMDFVVFKYLQGHLEYRFSDKPAKIRLLNIGKTVRFPVPKSRRDFFSDLLNWRAENNGLVRSGIQKALGFLDFLMETCKNLFRSPIRVFYQISCDIAIDTAIDDHDQLIRDIQNFLIDTPSGSNEEKLFRYLKQSLKGDGVDTRKFIDLVVRNARANFDYFHRYR
ncbi:MAG: hypothetical protein ACFFCW_26580 [Candidatus Hodarchaeota archaeon]